MARVPYEGNTKVYWATSIANKQAPTVAEINGATHLSPYVAKDGVAVNFTTNNVDSATIEDIFDAQGVGSYGTDLQLTMFRDDADESDAYDLIQYGTEGFLIISPFGPANWIGAPVHVFPAQMHEPAPMNSAANEQQKFVAKFAVTGAPAMRAAVVGS